MAWIREFFRQLRFRLRGARFDQDLSDELRLHAASLAAGRLVTSLIFGVQSSAPAKLAGAAVTLAVAAAIAAYVPARRAARLDPMVALRDE